MAIVHQTQHSTVHAGDCLDVLKELPDESVHAVITDPPYGLSNTTPAQVTECLREWATGNTTFTPAKRRGFMGKDWDSFVPPPAVWEECYRVLKPGGHLLAFAGSRTQDLMGMSVRMAGFDIRDNFAWLYGSGFPKSHDVSKAIDRKEGHQRGSSPDLRNGPNTNPGTKGVGIHGGGFQSMKGDDTGPISDDAKQWEGWGTALKPAFEPVIMARKPFKGTVAKNVLEHGTGAINIDASRIGTEDVLSIGTVRMGYHGADGSNAGQQNPAGRFPTNVLLDESQAAALDEQAGTARFFYCAKAPKSERPKVDGVAHPTVKPLALMRYLVRMVTPPGGTVLDPFAGSGTTLEAATQEGFTSIGIEAHTEYLTLIAHRLERTPEPEETPPARHGTAA